MDLSCVKTVLFDLDGTLIDTNELIIDTWRHTVKTMTGREITDEEVRLTFGELLIDSARRLMPDIDGELIIDFYRKFQREVFIDRIKLFDGAEEVLRKLRANGYKTALVTSRLKSSAVRGLIHFGLEDLFDAILTASDTEKFKPDPEPLFDILDMVGGRPEEAIFVGDTVYDIEAGRNAGVFTVLVGFSYALPPENRTTVAPDVVINELRDILGLLHIEEKENKTEINEWE